MRKWDPDNISKVKKKKDYMLLLSQFPVGLSHGQRYKMLSVDSKKEKKKQ